MSHPCLLVRSGQIDELLLQCRIVEFQQTGSARYRFKTQDETDELLEFNLWTSRVGQIKLETLGSVPWLAWVQSGDVVSFAAKNCLFHLEQIDCGFY